MPRGLQPGVRLAQQLEVGDDVLVVGDDAAELLEQVEADLRLEILDRRAQLRQAVADADRPHVVARRAQAADDVELGPALGRRLFGDAVERLRRHQRLVDEDEDAQPRHGLRRPARAARRRRAGRRAPRSRRRARAPRASRPAVRARRSTRPRPARRSPRPSPHRPGARPRPRGTAAARPSPRTRRAPIRARRRRRSLPRSIRRGRRPRQAPAASSRSGGRSVPGSNAAGSGTEIGGKELVLAGSGERARKQRGEEANGVQRERRLVRHARAVDGGVDRRCRRCVKPGDGRTDAGQRLGVGVRGIVRARVRIAGPLRRRERAGRGRADADASCRCSTRYRRVATRSSAPPGPRRRDRPATRGSRRGRAPSRSCRTMRRPAGRGSRARAHRPPRARAASRARGRAGSRRPRA